jgi:flagellar hook-associated protein 1 FlgK
VSLARLMNMGTRAMQTSQTALQTTGHNISNANTEGYTRQAIHTRSQQPINMGNLIIGDGADVDRVYRVHDQFLTKQMNREMEVKGKFEERALFLQSVESVFNESLSKGVSDFMGKFFNDMRKLATNPESIAMRTTVLESARYMVDEFHRAGNGMKGVQRNIDFKVASIVKETNSAVRELATLNKNIAKLELGGSPANDLRDRRDLILKKMAENMNIHTFEDGSTGMVSVTVAGAGTIVSGIEYNELQLVTIPETGARNSGLFDIILFNGNSSLKITDKVSGGKLAGMIEVRDGIIPKLQDKLDFMVHKFAREVNDAHKRGYGLDGKNGRELFKFTDNVRDSMLSIEMNEEIMDNVSKLATASRPWEPANNEVVTDITNIQKKRMISEEEMRDLFAQRRTMEKQMTDAAGKELTEEDKVKIANNEKTFAEKSMSNKHSVDDTFVAMDYNILRDDELATIDDYFNGIVGKIAVLTHEAKNVSEHQEGIVTQLKEFRESTSGVSLDEEGIDIIKYQKAFEAAAKMIQVADELLDTVMNLKRY